MHGFRQVIRKQVHIEEGQQERLSALAKELGLAEAEIIRRAIDLCLASGVTDPAIDSSLLKKVKDFIARLRRRRNAGPKRRWTREEIHDRGRR
jgi:predicted DNA-binding protein